MRVLVTGSRSWVKSGVIAGRIVMLPPGTEVIHGGALGADRIAGFYARAYGCTESVYLPAWRNVRDGPEPLERNDFMLELQPDLVLAFWDGESRGTAYTIREARKRGIPVEALGLDGQLMMV